MSGLEPGSFRLEAIDLADAHPAYAPIFSGGTTGVQSATSVGVLPAKTSTYNFNLGKAGSVTGTVVGAYGASSTQALAGVRVTAYSLVGTGVPFDSGTALDSPTTTTAANGSYTLTGLMPGTYTLEFQPPTTAAPAPASAVYGRTFLGNSDLSTSASYFTIANGTAITGQNITLVAGATIAGTVTNEATSFPIPDVEVTVDYLYQDPDTASEHAYVTTTDNQGKFTITGLGPGTYNLLVGSNASLDPTQTSPYDTSWARSITQIGPLTSGEDLNTIAVQLTGKLDGKMDATAQPSATP
jgi:hypothetical protein